VREHDREVDDALEHPLAGELLARQQIGERHAEHEGDRGGHERGGDGEHQGATYVALAQRLPEKAGAGAGDHACRRQNDERDEQRAGDGAQRPEERGAAAGHQSRRSGRVAGSRHTGGL